MEAHHSSSQTLRFKPLPVGLETFRVLLKRRAAYTCTIPCHHLAEKKCMVAKLEVDLEQVEDREVRGRFAVGNWAAFEDQPAVGALCLSQLIAQTGFTDAWLPDEADDLPTPLFNVCEDLTQCCQLPLSAHEATQGALPVHLQRGAAQPHPHDSVGADAV